ncbi:PREDICTED: protein PSY2-like [Camelina sativa]|uniref:Protein PSY2-like n=1 Tax=Camelina sativa TaxID=90675 RepID=A0ABM1RMF9_CAMSA|nr:PREDICTED: protein PSY2-like [Camelina sativa]
MSFGSRLLLFLILTLPLVTSSSRNTLSVSGIGQTRPDHRMLMVSIEDYGDPSANTRHDPSVPTNAKANTTP